MEGYYSITFISVEFATYIKNFKMKSLSSLFMTHAVSITGFDKAACAINNGVVESLCLQIKPGYCPTASWIRLFQQQHSASTSRFAITERGVCYLTIEAMDVKLADLQQFVDNLNQTIAQVNSLMGNEQIIEIIPLADCGLETRVDMSQLLDSIEWQ